MPAVAATGSTLHNVTDNQKRWLVFGIALNKVLVSQIRSFVEQEVQKEYGNLQTRCSIHTQGTSGRLRIWPTFLKYENINGNDVFPRLPGGRFDYSKFDCRVTSHVDFAKLYVENHMAKFNAFDEHCDASAVLSLLGKVPVFSMAVQSAAGDVRQARNAWAHCAFSDWDLLSFQQRFAEMEKLVKSLGLSSADEIYLVNELQDWENKGAILCMNATIDPDLVKTVQQDVNTLKDDIDKMAFEEEVNRENVKKALHDTQLGLDELRERVAIVEHEQQVIRQEQEVIKQDQSSLCGKVNHTEEQISEIKSEQQDMHQRVAYVGEHLGKQVAIAVREQDTIKQEQEVIKQDQSSLCGKVNTAQDQISELKSEQEDVQRRVTYLEDQEKLNQPQINYEIANCESEVAFFAARHDPATRQWLLKDFDKWFSDPGDSRAYVLLGDPGVGKSVMAAVMAQRSREAGHLGAAYFCRHNDNTRNDPRYLLGTIAYQLCKCNSQYSSIVGGEGGIRNLLGSCNLGIQELFTKLLQEPLNRCTPYQHRMLVVIDALDETEYKSRDDFLDLIMNRFPLLPEWLVFFITSRPEETVQFRLNKYNPCIKICAGSSAHFNFYQQHERDIKLFLEKRVDFSHLSYSVEDITKMCNGLFLYAFYISTTLNNPVHSGKINQLSDLFPGDIDSFFLQNFKRVFDKVGADLYWKLFGCAIVAPSPLPVSFISFIIQRENPDLDEQEVIDAVSQFVVLRTSDETFAFLHNLIPAWLTDKKKASRKFFVDRIKAGKYFRDIIVEFLSAGVASQRWEKPPTIEADLFDYFLRVGVRFLTEYREEDPINTVFNCLTSYQYIWKRVQNKGNEIYSLIVDLKLSAGCQGLSDAERGILQKICLALESNVHVLQGSPHLLHSCLRSSPKAVQENVVIPPDVVASTWMEWEGLPYPACEIPCDLSCFAVSPDKKLLAGGKGKSISLFDAYSLVKVLGPVEVIENDENISHLEFSPDGKFVFFGRLDKWFSVEKRCVAKFPQFLENCIHYKWVSFISGGRNVVVQRDRLEKIKHSYCCSHIIFFLWATQELHGKEGMESYENAILRDLRLRKRLKYEVLVDFLRFLEGNGIMNATLCSEVKHNIPLRFSVSPCQECQAYYLEKSHRETTLSSVRKRVIELYSEIFEYQVWDVQSGRPVLEQAFSSDGVLSPCTFLCHVVTALESNMALLSLIEKDGLSFFNVAIINLLSPLICRWPHNAHESTLRDSFVVKHLPIEFHNRLVTESRLSLDGKWIAVTHSYLPRRWIYKDAVILFNKRNLEYFDFVTPVHVIKDVEEFAFTDDSCVFLYVTKHRSLHAVSLQTGTTLSSASGFIPLYCTSEEHAGYFFHAREEEKIILAREFPQSFLSFFSIPSQHKSVAVTFTSADTISTLYSDCTVASWKTLGVEGSFAFGGLSRARATSTCSIHEKKAVFSPDGKLIATHQGTKILLLDYPTVLYSSSVGDCEHITSYLTFSPDSSLFLYCIPSSNNQPLFYVWDVQKKVMSATFLSPLGPQPVHCCCFSADTTKLILCCAFQISIWDYLERPCRLLANVEPFGPFSEFDKFSYCTVSSDNELLACCIVDRILLFPLSAAARHQTILQLPRAHLGRIEFCQFLKGTRYLISNGIDGTVFLWDLCEWKAIAYARVAQGRESIASLAVSPKEDEIVCLTSFDRLTRIKLCGLVHEMPTKSLTSDWTNREKIASVSHQQLGEQQQRSSTFESAASPVNDVEAKDWTALVEDMNFMADENLESDDDIYDSDSDK